VPLLVLAHRLTKDAIMTTQSTLEATARPSKAQARTGLVLSVLVTLFLLFDAIPKILKMDFVIQSSQGSGITPDTWPVIGTLLLVFTIAYNVPRIALFGAVLLTAYLGGAVCANVIMHMPFFSFVLAPVYVAILLWLGLYLRSAALRQLVRTGC
jgi:DoxX-like protein